jgi:peptide/nickel transport system substrate-binding protein
VIGASGAYARLAAGALLALLLASCGDGDGAAPIDSAQAPPAATAVPAPPAEPSPPTEPAPPPVTEEEADPAGGGTVRIGWEGEFGFTDGLDPTGEYLAEGWGILSSLLVRTLVGYRHVAGAPGDELVPDLATDLGSVSEDGLTVTFTLRDGVRFGPPLSRAITSDDVRFAFERIGTPPLLAPYAFYYDVVAGMREFAAGESDTIAGIETPDERTVVFHLTQPTGDFAYRLSLPAAAPLPPEVAGCFHDPAAYGAYLVSSGPYAIEGADDQDASSCETLEPLEGFDPAAELRLVRNPDYDPESDDTGGRTNAPDRFVFSVLPDAEEIVSRIESGTLDGEVATVSAGTAARYAADARLADRLHTGESDSLVFIALDVAHAPFDDVHMRRAANLAIDKRAVQLAHGESLASIATHAFPDGLLAGMLEGYDPYATAGSTGDEQRARAELAQSVYDTDGDGRCDDPACASVSLPVSGSPTELAYAEVVRASLAPLGIVVDVQIGDEAAESPGAGTLTLNVWGKDYADASTFAILLESSSIGPPFGLNLSLVGLTAEQAEELGLDAARLPAPSVDGAIAECRALTAGPERTACWAEVDRVVMEDVVPWIPLLAVRTADIVGPAVTRYEFDQFSGGPSWAHWAVDPARQTAP